MKQHALILRQLKQAARETETELDRIRTAIAALQNRSTKKRKLSAAAIEKISAAQRKRWKVFHSQQKQAA